MRRWWWHGYNKFWWWKLACGFAAASTLGASLRAIDEHSSFLRFVASLALLVFVMLILSPPTGREERSWWHRRYD